MNDSFALVDNTRANFFVYQEQQEACIALSRKNEGVAEVASGTPFIRF